MKKTYINPTTQVVSVELVQMIAESMGFGASVTSASGAESRRGGVWDDDEEE